MSVERHSFRKNGSSDAKWSSQLMMPLLVKVMVTLTVIFIFGVVCGYVATITFNRDALVINLENDRSSRPFGYLHKRATFNPCTSTSNAALREIVKSRLIDYTFIHMNLNVPEILYLLHSNMSSPLQVASNQIYTFLNKSMTTAASQNKDLRDCINQEVYSSRPRTSKVPTIHADLRHILPTRSRIDSYDDRQRDIIRHSQSADDVSFAAWKSEITLKADLSFQQVKDMIFHYRNLLNSMVIPVESRMVGLSGIDAFESKYMFYKWSRCCPEHQLEINNEALFATVRDCIKASNDEIAYDLCLKASSSIRF